MNSVTGRIEKIKQPRGGYIKPSQFETIVYDDGEKLNEDENIHGAIIGLAVDYLTRYAMGADKTEAFRISLKGAGVAELFGRENSVKTAEKLLKAIKGIDDVSVKKACKLVTFDVWLRNPMAAAMARDYKATNPNLATVQNIQLLIKRSLDFFDKYGPIVKEGFNFGPVSEDREEYKEMINTGKGSYGGYTATVSSGDGDFLTADTLWDFKVSKKKPTSKHTLQLLMYWIMGQHSGQEIYKSITKLGFYNPRLNTVSLLDVKDIPNEVIETVEKDVICY